MTYTKNLQDGLQCAKTEDLHWIKDGFIVSIPPEAILFPVAEKKR